MSADSKMDTESSGKEIHVVESDGALEAKSVGSKEEPVAKSEETKGETGVNLEVTKKEDMPETEGKSEETKEETAKKSEIDPYAYANSGETFTSEIFKIEIMNLPKFCGFKQMRKRLESLGVNPVKIKMPYQATYGFATFRNEDERTNALKVLDGHKWKGTTFRVKKAAPSADPLLKKRKIEAESTSDQSGAVDSPVAHKVSRLSGPAEGGKPALPAEERLKDAVTPTWREAYDRQLISKDRNMRNFISSLHGDVVQQNRDLRQWLQLQKRLNAGLICRLDKVKAAPQTEDYRNKCEFTVGKSESGIDKTLGFRLGSYRDGTLHVMSPEACNHIPVAMKTVVKHIEQYLQGVSPLNSFDPEGKDGHWRTITIRTNTEGNVMVVMHLNPMQLTKEEITAEKSRIKEFFESGAGKDCGVTSLFFQIKNEHRVRGKENNEEGAFELLLGQPYIHEKLLDLNFRISPAAFFQINTPAAEVLYSTVREWAGVSIDSARKTVLLDVCCGTGTIGLTMAKYAKRVVGIEMCKEAVEDAKVNAQLNGVSNCEFHCAKAEDSLPTLIKQFGYHEDVVAVVDPPRGGLNSEVIRALRKHEFVKRLVYVSCKATSVRSNIVDLMRAPSKRIKGEAFRLLRAVPVDLFPHTEHCELVMLFERGMPADDNQTQQQTQQQTNSANQGQQSTGGDGANVKVVDQSADSKVVDQSADSKVVDQGADSKVVDQSADSKVVDQGADLKVVDQSASDNAGQSADVEMDQSKEKVDQSSEEQENRGGQSAEVVMEQEIKEKDASVEEKGTSS